ncbi:hypothetical protein Sjap_000235 [Stephania japonica]|uniref:Uncharacterized protein n=1 Tax=Stephania japonica TaxID=461633 RepID=A0AAP0PS96_9MAGN
MPFFQATDNCGGCAFGIYLFCCAITATRDFVKISLFSSVILWFKFPSTLV